MAVSRWPWQPKHVPFLLAHAGILILLAGSWITEKFGLDSSVRIAEGETTSVTELDKNSLVLTDSDQIRKVSVPWVPPTVQFQPIRLQSQGLSYDLTIDRFLSHADPSFAFIPADSTQSGLRHLPRPSSDSRAGR